MSSLAKLLGRVAGVFRPARPAEPSAVSEVAPEETPPPSPVQPAQPAQMHRQAKFQIGQVVKHRMFPFRGVIFDVDPEFNNTEEWYESIPEEVRPHKEQPYYHLFAENERTYYVAYVSEQNLLLDHSHEPVNHPDIGEFFDLDEAGDYRLKSGIAN